MAHRGNLKLVDKFQFNEKKFTTSNGVDEFEAVHVDSKHSYTLKRMGINNASEGEHSNRIMHERSNKLAHNLVPRCHKLLRTSNNMYLIYDRISGNTLYQFLRNDITSANWKNKLKTTLFMAEQLCDVLAYFADRKICHSHINLHNIIVQNQAIFKIINFSDATELQTPDGSIEIQEKNREIDEYCCPEMRNGKLTLKSDTYSMGVVLQKMFIKLKESISEIQNIEKEAASIDIILSFCRTKMKSGEISQRINAKEASTFFKEKQYGHIKEEATEKTQDSRGRLLTTDPGVRTIHFQEQKMSKQRSHSPFASALKLNKTHLSDVGSETQEYFYIARKVLHKRNLSNLLLELSDFCTQTLQSSSQRSIPLSFLLIKKSTLIVTQLAKFLDTGRGEGLKMEEKTRERLKKHKMFANLQKIIHVEMRHLQERLVGSAQLLKEALGPAQGKEQLRKELESEVVDNQLFRKCVSNFENELYLWSYLEEDKVEKQMNLCKLLNKKHLVLLFVLSLLTDFRTIEQMFDQLFGENGSTLWNQSFFVDMMNMHETQIEALILQQGKLKVPKSEDALSSSHSVSVSRRKL